MPKRRSVPRTLQATRPMRLRDDTAYRDYSAFRYTGSRPSLDFDWDAALYRFACIMRDLGYTLSAQQQDRIDDHDNAKD